MNIPADLQYTEDHEWVKIEGDTATIGITAYAAQELGDIVYVEIETLDEDLDAMEAFGTVEAVKTVSDLFMPVAGTVVEINEILEDSPETVNEDPYGKGWLVKIKIKGEVEGLMSPEAYTESIGQ